MIVLPSKGEASGLVRGHIDKPILAYKRCHLGAAEMADFSVAST